MELVLKGFIIGIGKIIPGVSGSMFAISLGIYEQIIEKIANMKDDMYENIKFLTKVCIGIVLSIILTSKIIVKCIDKYYLPTILLFIGLIVGGFPNVLRNTRLKKKNIMLSILIIIIIGIIINKTTISCHIMKYSLNELIILVGIGIIDAISSIVPGISGTAILMTLGYYNILMESFSSILVLKRINKNIFILIPFLFGFIIGVIIVSKIINKLLKKYRNIMNTIIMILMISTIIPLIKKILQDKPQKIEIIIGLILLVIGTAISKKIENMNSKNKM